MTNKRIGKYEDPHNENEFHWIETQTIPSIVLDVSVLNVMYQPEESQAMINEFDIDKKIESPVIEYYLEYEDAEEAVSLVGKVNVGSKKMIESSPVYMDAEEFGQAVFHASFKTEKNQSGKLELSPLMHEAMRQVNLNISQKFYANSGIIFDKFSTNACGFLTLKEGNVKIATLENFNFSEDRYRGQPSVTVGEVISSVDFSDIQDLKVTLESPEGIRMSADAVEGTILDGTNHFTNVVFSLRSINVSRVRGDEEIPAFEKIEDENERILNRISLLDDTRKERANNYNRFFDLL